MEEGKAMMKAEEERVQLHEQHRQDWQYCSLPELGRGLVQQRLRIHQGHFRLNRRTLRARSRMLCAGDQVWSVAGSAATCDPSRYTPCCETRIDKYPYHADELLKQEYSLYAWAQ